MKLKTAGSRPLFPLLGGTHFPLKVSGMTFAHHQKGSKETLDCFELLPTPSVVTHNPSWPSWFLMF